MTDLYATFRPRRARIVSLWLSILLIVATCVLFAVVPTSGASFAFGPSDFFGTALLSGGIVVFLYLQYQVRIEVSESGIFVKNLIYSHRLEWEQLIAVDFGGGPWARIDTTEGESIAVMAIQRSDGDYARREARRLATLIEAHTAPDPDV
ncbi:MAG: PH domain-containing protein [Flaviflexus sp.]|nr:PH domain-containing protein [Flaviflexus sp.]